MSIDMDKLKAKLLDESISIAKNELGDFFNELKEDHRADAEECIESIAELTIKMALTADENEKEAIRATIGHFKNSLENIEGAIAYKSYSRLIKIIGDVIAAIGVGVVSALL